LGDRSPSEKTTLHGKIIELKTLKFQEGKFTLQRLLAINVEQRRLKQQQKHDNQLSITEKPRETTSKVF